MDKVINIDDYQEIQSFQIGGTGLFMGWNQNSSEAPYLICNKQSLGFGNYYSNVLLSDNYLEIAKAFIDRVQEQIHILEAFQAERNLPMLTLGTEYCRYRGDEESLEGKVIILKPESLAPEYRTADYQLAIATNGFGCSPHARGKAVYITELYSGEQYRMNAEDVLGIADLSKLPEWASEKLEERRAEMVVEKTTHMPHKKKSRGGNAR